MIKKAGNIAIIILLLIATGGVPVTRHYCGLVQKSVSFYTTPKSCCGEGCEKCHNVLKFNKISDDFEAGSFLNAQSINLVGALHSSFYVDLFSILNIPPDTDLVSQRANFNHKAGYAPASIGSFRC